MSQPQCSLMDYHGGKSIVLRSVPEDFFKSYSGYLVQMSGKWNPNLKDPTGQGKQPGWIFPKKNEPEVRQSVQQICSGQVPPMSEAQVQPQPQPFFQTQQPVNTLQALLSAAQARDMSQTQVQIQPQSTGEQSPSVFNVAPQPITTLNLASPSISSVQSLPPGYQQVTYIVIKPDVGSTLQLTVGKDKIPVRVESNETQGNIINQAIIQLPDGRKTMIRLSNDQWIVPGFSPPHSITLQ